MTLSLFPHQLKGVQWLWEHPRTALFWDVGLGKTLPPVYAAQAPLLVVCPRYLRFMWQDALTSYVQETTWRADSPQRVAVVEGTTDQRSAILADQDAWAYIVNYEMVRLGRASSISTAKFPALFKRQWGTVIFDEAHKLRGRHAGWTLAARKLRTERLYMLTGTPHVTNWGDVWPLLRLIDKKAFSGYHHFVDTWLQTFPTAYGKDVGAPKDSAAFGQMLDQYVLRHTYESAGRPRPQYVEHDIPTELTDATRKKMADARESHWVHRVRKAPIKHADGYESVQYLDEYVPATSDAMLALEMRMHVAHDPVKQEALVDLVASVLDREEDVIVWTYYQEAAQVAYGLLDRKWHDHVALVTGEIPDKKRTEAVAQFKVHGGVLVATLGALSEGENLQRATSQVFYECDYRGTVNQQAIGRSARTGQEQIVQVYNLVARRSPDERVLKVARGRTQAGQSPWKEIVSE